MRVAHLVQGLGDIVFRGRLALCLQALQHILEDGRVVVVDVQIVSELETNLRAAAAVGAADADHKMVVLREGLCTGRERI